MKKMYGILLLSLFTSSLFTQDLYKDIGSAELYAGPVGKAVTTQSNILFDSRESYGGDTIYFNGTCVNGPASGPGVADSSILQNLTLGMSTLGAGHQLSALNRVADDFSISGYLVAGWQIDSIAFFAYQTGSTLTSTINHVNLRIWQGSPADSASGSTIVFGDDTTNQMIGTAWSNTYRFSEGTVATNRPVMRNVVAVDTFLPIGTSYWLDWQSGGTLASGPWAPPIAIKGVSTTGNSLQKIGAGAWAALNDGGTLTPQGQPFVIYGTPVYFPIDYGITEFVDLPTTFMQGVTYDIKARVQNYSSVTVNDVLVRFFVDGSQQGADQLITLDSLADSVVTFSWMAADPGEQTLKIQSFLLNDTNPADDYKDTLITVAPLTYILTHSVSDSVISGNSVGCTSGSYHVQNSFWRSFVLDSFSVNTDLQVDSVMIGIQQAQSSGGSQPVICNLYTTNTAFPGGTLTLIHSDTTIIADQNLTLMKLNSTGIIPVGSELVVEINLPNGQTNVNLLFMGSNNLGQTAPTYISAADCGITVPTDITAVGFPGMHLILTVYGSVGEAIAVDVTPVKPAGYALHQNYPNPFNPTTTIKYDLKDAGKVTLKVYNILGQEVRTLVNTNEMAGFKSVVWDGKDNSGKAVSSGLYIYRLETGKFAKSHKMMLLK